MTLSRSDYAFVQRLVLDRSAIAIRPEQEYLVRSRLELIAREAGLPDLTTLIRRLRLERDGALHAQVVEAMTINETSFFRDAHPFDALRNTLVPELIAKQRIEKTFHVWSAASSTGQEPYSLAMTLRDSLSAFRDWRFRILATDISNAALERAREGRYSPLEIGRGLSPATLAHHFVQRDGGFEVKPELRASIEWKRVNLAGRWPAMLPQDLVFIRNVLIYFAPKTVYSILERVLRALRPGGYLVLGSTERLPNGFRGCEPLTIGRTTLYRRTA